MLSRRDIKLHVDRHLCEAREMMLPRVRTAFEGLLQERGLLTSDLAPYFGPLGHPLFELPVWVAGRLSEDGVETPDDVLGGVLGISALGYFHVRAQDDWLDAVSPGDPTLVAVAEALLAMCNRLLVAVVGPSARFWRFYAEVLNAYSESLVQVEEVRKGKAPVVRLTFEQLLAQSRPLVIPSTALLDCADRWDLRPRLEEFVFTATAASQIFNDLTGLYRDHSMGHRTWTLEAVGDPDVDALWSEVARAWSGNEEDPIQKRIREALAFHERSTRAARGLELTAAESWLADRQAMLEGLLGSLRTRLLATFVRRLGGSAG